MSGGSCSYLFLSDNMAEVASKMEGLERMAEELALFAPDHPVTAYTQRLLALLQGEIPQQVGEVWHAMEWMLSADWGHERLEATLGRTQTFGQPEIGQSP